MTEQNIFQEIQEDLERQKYEELWKRYGMWIVSAAVIIVVTTGGISWWRSWHATRNQEATAALIKIVERPEDKPDPAQELSDLEKFSATSHSTAHETLAQLGAAGLAINAGNIDKAVQIYDAVAKNSSVDPAFRQYADLMSVRAQLDTGDPAQLEKRLAPLLTDDAPWHFTATECEAFLALRMGDKDKARRIFTDLSQDARVPRTLGARATDMLHFLSE